MVKSIIKRIIVGVGIALILMLCKDYILMDVHAESINVNPDKICAINGTSDSCTYITPLSYQVAERTMYGNTFGADASRQRIIWHFSGTDIQEKTYDIDFILFLQGTSADLYPNRGYIGNSNDNIYSCDIDKSRWAVVFNGTSGSTSGAVDGSVMVHCSNVYLSDNNFTFYLFDLATRSNGVMAVSHATLTESVSSKQTQAIEEINDNITDDSVDSSKAESDIDEMKDKIASNGSITQLLTLPITLYQSILNSLNGSCSSISLGSLFNHNLTMPCINLQSLLGSTLYNIIDILCCGLFILSFRKKMVDIFNHMTSLNDRGNELE